LKAGKQRFEHRPPRAFPYNYASISVQKRFASSFANPTFVSSQTPDREDLQLNPAFYHRDCLPVHIFSRPIKTAFFYLLRKGIGGNMGYHKLQ
jgi:hypothetical protein